MPSAPSATRKRGCTGGRRCVDFDSQESYKLVFTEIERFKFFNNICLVYRQQGENILNAPPAAVPSAESRSFRKQLIPLLLLTSIFFVNFCARVLFAPLMPAVESALGFGHAQAGSLFFLLSAGYFLSLFSSGWIAARLIHRHTILLSISALGVTLVAMAFCNSLALLRIGFFLLGAFAGLYLPSGIATLTALVESRHWGKAAAVHELAPNLALVVAPLAAEILLSRFSWRSVPLVFGAVAVLLSLAFLRNRRLGGFTGRPPDLKALRDLLSRPALWILMGLFGLGISSTLGVYTMLPLYLVDDLGLDRNVANTLLAVSRISGLVMALIGGWTADRFGPQRTLVTVLMLTGAATVAIGMAPGRWALLAVFIQPLLAVCFFPAGFAALSRIGPAADRNIAVSLTIPAAFLIGGGAVPAMIGWFGDHVSFGAGILLVGLLIGSGGFLARYLNLKP